VACKYNLDNNRYGEFQYCTYLDIEDYYVDNYIRFQLDLAQPDFKHRLSNHTDFWRTLNTEPWLLDIIKNGIRIPFERKPPRMLLQNTKAVLENDNVPVVRQIIREYLQYGFIAKVEQIPYCVLPLQIKVTSSKTALIYDMSPLNLYVEKSKFKLEGWEEMFYFATTSDWAIKFDLKKFYHEIDVHVEDQKYFGFMFQMEDNMLPEMFVWTTMPYGYTRAPFIAKSLIKPLLCHWRRLGARMVVFYDDGMAVSDDKEFLQQLSIQIQCDLVRAGLVPGVGKCIWDPVDCVDWNGLRFDFVAKGISILERRIQNTLQQAEFLLNNWPNVCYRDVAKFVGQLMSMHPVLQGLEQLKSRNLQSLVNIRHYKNCSWDAIVQTDYAPMLDIVKFEIQRWQCLLATKNFRPFVLPAPSCVAWADASDRAVAAVAAVIDDCTVVPVTADNWLLSSKGAYRRLRNCVQLQVGSLPWLMRPEKIVRDDFDLDPVKVKKLMLVHRNLTFSEIATDSNERELLAAVQFLESCGPDLESLNVTLHFDNLNASIICTKGSPKIRLQKYAERVFDITEKYHIKLNAVWIPRDLNNVADILSKTLDYEDYSITDVFFQQVCEVFEISPIIDCFANNVNAKTKHFFSLTFCPGTTGVDCFSYNWRLYGCAWLFPPPRLIVKTVLFLETCKGEGVLLAPQWKNSHFYTFLQGIPVTNVKKRVVFDGKNIFCAGIDVNSYFGPNFKGNVECWHLSYDN
jgi:Reverse transcriptase (RNA-dependent DNA polymerase)